MIALPEDITIEEARAVAMSLTPDEAEALDWDWGAWARPEQTMPEGDWRTWLLLGGRGSGKTRPCAEAVREVARDPKAVIALIAPTAADVRQVMIEGESGIINVCPAEERPHWQPSIRKLAFPSGAVAFTYSADAAERLRGPQHSFCWCLTGDTAVLMADGSEKPLGTVRAGDRVMARNGASTVTAQYLTRRNAEVFRLITVAGREIIGTSDHPVYVAGHGFVPLGDIQPGMSLLCANSVSNGMDSCGIATGRRTTGNGRFVFTAPYGKPSMARCPMATTSITSTEIPAITASKISSCSATLSTAASICRTRYRRKIVLAVSKAQLRQCSASGRRISTDRSLACGAVPDSSAGHSIPAHIAHANASRPHGPVPLAVKFATAFTAAQNTKPCAGFNCIAQPSAIRARMQHAGRMRSNGLLSAPGASKDSRVSEATRDSVRGNALSPFTQCDQVSSVRKLANCADVYDIATDAGEFFANGILVHNCDEIAAFDDPKAIWDLLLPGMRLGNDPRRIVSTTPKPLKFLHDLIADPYTVTSRMKTWDNRANLPDTYISELQRIYGGTRIGRQELEGELLDEAEGALWRRATLDALRVREAPELARIVIAIDPSTTSGENSDECGIIGAGLGTDGHGYVLADRSCRLPPDQWASRAVSLYDQLEADKIIAETNNGGDLVESVLRTVRRNIAYEKITASRGKVVRAEPIAALYEQARVHHVGGLNSLEDEMVNFVPGALTCSPNRADALVWALSWLMLKNPMQGRALWVG